MAYRNGEIAEVYVGATKVAGVMSYSYDHEVAEVDDSELGEDFDKVAAGPERWAATLSIKADTEDAGQQALALGAEVTCNFYNAGNSTGEKYRTGTGVVLKLPLSVERGARQTIEVSIGGRSKLTEATVT